MKCNVRELALLSDQPCVIEGRLNYKKVSNASYRHQAVFKERWFRLINNYLFYFKISEMGKFDTKNPAGMFVMENSSIQMEHGLSLPFSFSISFIDEPEKRHVFAARAEDNVVQWVIKLRECSYEYLRERLHTLQSKIYSITGKDPLLMVPRNEGACLWAPAVPFSTVPACSVNTSSFSCHLHTNGAFTLERSKSDVQAHRHLRTEITKKTTFYTDKNTTNTVEFNKTTFYTDDRREEKDSSKQTFALERSKTSGLLPGVLHHANSSIFDNRPQFSRAAPSPPVRKKLSPTARRAERDDIMQLNEQGRIFGSTGILDVAPVKPKRKVSPKNPEVSNSTTNSSENIQASEDLIQF